MLGAAWREPTIRFARLIPLLGSTALHVGGDGVVWELQGDGSAGEHDGGQRGLGTVEAVGTTDDQRTLLFSPS
jgi:hypothetical protein